MILLLDIGNTRVKWRVVAADGDCVAESAFDPAVAVADFIVQVSAYDLSAVWVAEVGDVLQRLGLQQAIDRAFPALAVHRIDSEAQCLGVRDSYAEPHRLGVDRWLAAVEAWCANDGRPVAVFDFGTAAKLDVVADGRHQGGHIVPGLAMMRQVLRQNTRKVVFEAEDTYKQGWGNSTAAAVENGTWVMLMAWLERELQAFYAAYPQGLAYLMGGDAAHFSQSALVQANSAAIAYSDNLVLDALWRLASVE